MLLPQRLMGQDAMASLSLREAAEQAGPSKSTIWRAIKAGRLSATRTDDGGFAIDPAELFRVFPLEQAGERFTGQDATSPEPLPERPETAEPDGLAAKIAAAEAEIAGLKALLASERARDEALIAELRTNRDELRQDRDEWRGRAERFLAPPERRPWWRRLVS
jgi:hypothetical protein